MSIMLRCDNCGRTSWDNIERHTCGKCAKHQLCGYCSGLLIQITDKEIKDENERQRQATADAAKKAREESKLPKWCLSAIAMRAYEDGHSAGQQEVDDIEMGMISDFEIEMRKENTV